MILEVKVILFTDTFCDINGVSRFIQDISLLANERKLAFYVITSTLKSCPDLPNVYNIKPKFRMQMPFYPEIDMVYPASKEIEKIVDMIEPNVIHISTPGMVGWIGRKIAKKRNISMIGTYHTDFPAFAYKNIPFGIVRMISNKVMECFYRDFAKIFVRSDAYKEIVHRDVKFDKALIHTLKAGIDTQKFNRTYRDMTIWEEYGIPQDAIKALYVGRLTKEKNFPQLVEQWKAYYEKSKNKNIYLIAVGGELPNTLNQTHHIYALGIKRGVELSKIYASSDLFLFPSTTDTLGQVVMEAMSSGLPVVVSHLGGPKTVVEEAKGSGFAIDIADNKMWLEAIERLICDEVLRKSMGEIGSAFIAQKGIAQSFDAFWQVHIESVI